MKIRIEKTGVVDSPFTIGFNYPVDIAESGGTNTGAPIGFNSSLGSVSQTVLLDKDLI